MVLVLSKRERVSLKSFFVFFVDLISKSCSQLSRHFITGHEEIVLSTISQVFSRIFYCHFGLKQASWHLTVVKVAKTWPRWSFAPTAQRRPSGEWWRPENFNTPSLVGRDFLSCFCNFGNFGVLCGNSFWPTDLLVGCLSWVWLFVWLLVRCAFALGLSFRQSLRLWSVLGQSSTLSKLNECLVGEWAEFPMKNHWKSNKSWWVKPCKTKEHNFGWCWVILFCGLTRLH